MHHRNSQFGHHARFPALIAAALALAGCSSKPPCEDDSLALVMAHDFIARELKAPASAEFPYSTDPGVSITRSASDSGKACAFTIKTYVDAQNSFGAQIRTNFLVKVAPDDSSGKSWSLELIQAN